MLKGEVSTGLLYHRVQWYTVTIDNTVYSSLARPLTVHEVHLQAKMVDTSYMSLAPSSSEHLASNETKQTVSPLVAVLRSVC